MFGQRTVTHYERVKYSARKVGVCPGCGERAERTVTLEQTLNPFNKNADGTVRNRVEVHRALGAEAERWRAEPTWHRRCEQT